MDPYAPSLGALPPAPLPAPAFPLCSARAGAPTGASLQPPHTSAWCQHWPPPQFTTAGTTWAGGETQTFHTKFKAVVNSTNRKGRLGKRPVFQVPWSYISIEGGPVFHSNLPMELAVLSAFHVKCWFMPIEAFSVSVGFIEDKNGLVSKDEMFKV